ncbi:5-oxoprolinase (ATP-hydrolyzing) [Purpureocillium lavendulum]|uniref:5-oxoprolinase (ATP-hydrolyzing) n=1 Tax=Purpureocillium lavendulum TaxID=1247861 RepID=A0AB34FHP1_9HYPO|nr:5-oxoprolinase (ATP-hydrolyzing) [Purpureocillium lavendulum]
MALTAVADPYEIGVLKDETIHSKTYCARRTGAGAGAGAGATHEGDVEARVFDLQDCTQAQRRYRARCIKRLAARTVFRTTFEGQHVVIIRTGPLQQFDDDDADDVQRPSHGVDKCECGHARQQLKSRGHDEKQPAAKTAYQQESQRLRQRDRRRRARQRKRDEGAADQETTAATTRSGADPPPSTQWWPAGDTDFDETTYLMLQMLYIASCCGPEDLAALPEEARRVIGDYTEASPERVVLDDEDDLEEFLALKAREIAYLNRQMAKLAPALEACQEQAERVLLREAELVSSGTDSGLVPTDEAAQAQAELAKAILGRCDVLTSAQVLLPGLVAAAKETRADVRAQLARLREDIGDEEDIWTLKTRVDNYASWLGHLLPSSEAYAQLYSKYEAARRALGRRASRFS